MKRLKYELKIEQACSKEWTSMNVNNDGRYCLHCEKTVIDFTKLSDYEIIQIIEQSSRKLCGRLNAHQLNRILESKQVSKNSQLYKLITGLLLIGSAGNSFASKGSETITTSEIIVNINETERNENTIIEKSVDDSLKNRIKGTIFDAETKEVLPFVKVYIKETNSKILSDIDGNFVINLPDSLILDSLIIVIKNVGYKEQEFIVDRKDFRKPAKIFLSIPEEQFILGEVIYIEKKKKWWQFRK